MTLLSDTVGQTKTSFLSLDVNTASEGLPSSVTGSEFPTAGTTAP